MIRMPINIKNIIIPSTYVRIIIIRTLILFATAYYKLVEIMNIRNITVVKPSLLLYIAPCSLNLGGLHYIVSAQGRPV